MDKRHLAKGISKQTRKWVTGYVTPLWTAEGEEDRFAIDCGTDYDNEETSLEVHEVFPETICRHTGHPNEIYEGDESRSWYGAKGFCMWNENECQWVIKVGHFEELPIPLHKTDDWKPTGQNIHDKKEVRNEPITTNNHW